MAQSHSTSAPLKATRKEPTEEPWHDGPSDAEGLHHLVPPFDEPGRGMTEEERQAFLTSRNNRPPDPFDRKPGHKTHPYVDSYGPEQHVLPTNDLVEHETSEDCVCIPKVTFLTDGKVVTHNSLDGREHE